MSKESAIRFLKGLRKNEDAMELLRAKAGSAGGDARTYAEIATEVGEDVTPEDMAAAMEEVEAEVRQSTQTATDEAMELDDSDLQRIAGGSIFDICHYSQSKYTVPIA